MPTRKYEIIVDENVLIPTTGGLRLACKLWQVSGLSIAEHAVKLICYPGWLDNSGSFDTCAEILCGDYGFAVLAVDPPGCGLSDHRPRSSLYNDYEEPPLIADIADELGWETFGLVGHSRGGGVCTLAAGLLRERVKVFVCIDSYFALSGLWINDMKATGPLAPSKMRQARAMAKKNLDRPTRVFATFDEAVMANKNNPHFRKAEVTAKNIVKRHLRPCAGGWTFTHDVRTYGQNQYLHLAESQLSEFLECVTAPTMQILETDRWELITNKDVDMMEVMNARAKLIKAGCTVVDMSGKGHHFHSDCAQEFCDVVAPWIVTQYGIPEKRDALQNVLVKKAHATISRL